MPVGEMGADPARLRIDDPHFLGAVGEVKLHFEIQLGGGIGFGRDFDGQGWRALQVSIAIRIAAFQKALVHDYLGLDIGRIWIVTQQDIPD